jgi:ribonuclease T2
MKRLLCGLFAALLLASGVAAAKDRSGHFDYYVLALSWSPVYCEHHPEDEPQCGKKHFGFVLHGLWPQYARGGYPQSCSTSQRLTEEARAKGMAVFPSEKLVAHEWQKHGTCSGMDALDYFKAADDARNSIAIPPRLQPGEHTLELTAKDIAKAVRDENPAITNKSIAVVCSGPELAEVRVCMSKDLKPMSCGRDVRSSCRPGPVRVPGAK